MEFGKHVQVRNEKFGSVVFETLKEKVFATNESGKEILALLKENKSPAEIVDTLCANYSNSDRQTIENDVAEYIKALVERSILMNQG